MDSPTSDDQGCSGSGADSPRSAEWELASGVPVDVPAASSQQLFNHLFQASGPGQAEVTLSDAARAYVLPPVTNDLPEVIFEVNVDDNNLADTWAADQQSTVQPTELLRIPAGTKRTDKRLQYNSNCQQFEILYNRVVELRMPRPLRINQLATLALVHESPSHPGPIVACCERHGRGYGRSESAACPIQVIGGGNFETAIEKDQGAYKVVIRCLGESVSAVQMRFPVLSSCTESNDANSGSTEEARRWVLKVRCHDDDEVHIPMQVYASLKRVEGRNVKATGRVDTRRRRQPPVSVRSQPPVAAAASSSSGNNEEMEEVELLRRGYQSKVMRMSRDMRRLKLQEFRLRGLI